MIINYSSKFYKEYKRLSSEVKKKAEKQENIFRQNPFDPRLKTHRLTGKLQNLWSFSVDYKTRIIFEFASENLVWFHNVGSHSIYK
ncbi:MAG: type II toxin-antitoxin system mRNA interferase toxin, RelE/StbE family [Candidatus Shapirobacteria bacterium]|nr:type II toxin-antitoxin system mRNA interferase toxin, RelE/StbE family [Candidatus Shapirobacteria bacterium]